jgi:hypothetical protein
VSDNVNSAFADGWARFRYRWRMSARYFAVLADDGWWCVVDHLVPDRENFGPFSSAAEAQAEIESPYADKDLPVYLPTAAERAAMREAKFRNLVERLAA